MSTKGHAAHRYVGTNAERVALATGPLTTGTLWIESDTQDIYTWDGIAWSAGGGGAPVDAEYVVMSLDATLTDERVLTAGTGINLADGGAGGAATLSVDETLYLRLDATNDPVTAGLEINEATADEPVLILQSTDDDATNPGLLIQDLGGNTQISLAIDGGAIFNEEQNDVDFRVESNSQANMLFVDGGFDSVLINTAVDFSSTFGVQTTAAADIGIVIRGSASQTASLQEWQNPGGAVYLEVSPLGYIGFGASGASTIRLITAAGISVNSAVAFGFIDADITNTGNGGVTGQSYQVRTSGSGSLVGILSNTKSLNGGTPTSMQSILARFQVDNGGAATNWYGVFVEDGRLVGSGTLTNQYGIYLEDQLLGGTLNYAIYTNAGLVRFGDTVSTHAGKIHNTTRVVAAYTALSTDEVIFCDTDGGAYTLDLPAGVEGTHYKIINCGSSGNDLTVDPNGAEELYGAGAGVASTVSDGEVISIHYNATEGWF